MTVDKKMLRRWQRAILLIIGSWVEPFQAWAAPPQAMAAPPHTLAVPTLAAAIALPSAELVAIARLPADTLIPGDTSGQYLDPEEKATHFIGPPYPDAQPVQGISALAEEGSSGGFEGMALDREQGVLYPMLEKALPGTPGVLEIFAFDIASKQFQPADKPVAVMRYPLDEGVHALGAFQYLGDGTFLTVERDRG